MSIMVSNSTVEIIYARITDSNPINLLHHTRHKCDYTFYISTGHYCPFDVISIYIWISNKFTKTYEDTFIVYSFLKAFVKYIIIRILKASR